MKAALGSVVVAAALLVAAQAPIHAAPQTTTVTTPDSTLAKSIERKIHNSTLKKYDVRVDVDNGVATLKGTVPTEADRRKAAQLATMKGIARVDNQIVVDLDAARAKGTTGKAADKTKEGLNKAVDKSKEGIEKATEATKEGASKAADKTAQGLSKTGEVITDVWIKTRVKSKFIDEDVLKGSDIEVDVNDHVVTLSGTVPSAAGRLRAIEEAKKVEGVHNVIDKMTIGPKK
jgi:hyperosmotically inducible protein